MLQILIIAACIIVHLGDEVERAPLGPRWFYAYFALLALMAIGVQIVCWRARVRMDRVGWGYARHAADRSIFVTRVACVLLHAASVLGLGELAWIRSWTGDLILVDEALCVLPVILFFVAGWWSIYPLERRVREALLYRDLHTAKDVPPLFGRGRFVWGRVREGLGIALIPISLATASLEVLDRFGPALIKRLIAGTTFEESASTIQALASTLVVLGVLAIAPALVRLAWDLVPLPEGGTRRAIASVMQRRTIRVIGPLVWRTGGDSVNAAVLGAIFPFRYMVFTDALLANLPVRQLQAVTAHEIAHVRLHHMPWIMVCVFASVYAIGWVASIGAWAVGGSLESEAATLWLSLGVLVPIAWIFGAVSRRMEWQADAFAAKVMAELTPAEPDVTGAQRDPSLVLAVQPTGAITIEAATAVAGALQTVADLNAMDPSARSFRHGSIRTRQRRVLALVGQNPSTLAIDRTVRRIKFGAVAALALAGAIHVAATVI